ncbi:MAG: flagellar biosynthesis, partial [Syntrophaceae bacterium]|nr:flagellar biosynthesis [Syntrophaceae bacterium]
MKKGQEQERILAAAIKYDSATDSAPKVTASGRGIVAEKIIAVAQDN